VHGHALYVYVEQMLQPPGVGLYPVRERDAAELTVDRVHMQTDLMTGVADLGNGSVGSRFRDIVKG
jgi:hypothetical protein